MNGCKHTKDNRNFQWPEGFSISDIQTKISIKTSVQKLMLLAILYL